MIPARPYGGHRGCYCACYRAYGLNRHNRQVIDHKLSLDDIRTNRMGHVPSHCRAPANRRRFCYTGICTQPF